MRQTIVQLSVVALLAIAIAGAGVQARVLDWSRYSNDRFGVSLEFPKAIFRFDRASDRGDGELYRSRDGQARLLIGAFGNHERRSPRAYQRYIANESYPGATIDYAPVGKTWTVLSGARGDMMFYEKVFFRCGGDLIGSFAMIYPVAERDLYDPIVERMEDSFRVSREACGRIG
jgi:hypothetical protein